MKKLDTALLSIGIAIAIPIGQALLTLSDTTFDDPWPWLRALAIGVAVGLGSRLYKWGESNSGSVTLQSPIVRTPVATAPEFTSEPQPAPIRPQAASPVVLPEGWAANQPQAPEATSVSPPV